MEAAPLFTIGRHFALDNSDSLADITQHALKLFADPDRVPQQPWTYDIERKHPNWITPQTYLAQVYRLFEEAPTFSVNATQINSKPDHIHLGKVRKPSEERRDQVETVQQVYCQFASRVHTIHRGREWAQEDPCNGLNVIIEIIVDTPGLLVWRLDLECHSHDEAYFGEVLLDEAQHRYTFSGLHKHLVSGQLFMSEDAMLRNNSEDAAAPHYGVEVFEPGIYWAILRQRKGTNTITYRVEFDPGPPEERHARKELEKAVRNRMAATPAYGNGTVTPVQENFFANIFGNGNGNSAH